MYRSRIARTVHETVRGLHRIGLADKRIMRRFDASCLTTPHPPGRHMNPHLFVYGTLLSGAGHPRGARLAREARLLGAATIQGCRLYSLGRYPGLVEATDAPGLVHGEVFALNSPAASLEWLDAYEGIVPGNHDQNQYERVERPVELATGGTITAWVYLYRKDVERFRALPEGRWLSDRA